MKKWGLILVVTIVMMVLAGVSGIASAATMSFEASDPVDTTNPDFDIVAFGATPDGNYVDLWIQVRGNINTQPENGYMNAYVIEINSNTDYEIASIWFNANGNIQYLGWFKVGENTNPLPANDIKISGNKITYHIDAQMLSGIGDEYSVTVQSVHAQGNNPSMLNTYADEAEYYQNAQSGGSSGGNNGGNGGEGSSDMGMLYGMGILAIYLACIFVWIIIWIIVAWWAYKDAKSRCMDSPIVWFLVVLLLGLIGLIIYLIVRKDQCQKDFGAIPPPPS